MAKILVADDDEGLIGTLTEWLKLDNHIVDAVHNGSDALGHLKSFEYDLIVLDWSMPAPNGLEVCKQYRAGGGNAPIIMLTGKGAVEDKMEGLEAGADDYLTKPFHFKELTARLRALLRRPPQLNLGNLTVRDIVVDLSARKVTKGGKELSLQPLEFRVLEFLAKHPGQVFSPEVLLRRIWDSDAEVSHDAIYACMKRLRKKLESEGEPPLVVTVYGAGYKLQP
jgi:DNA-binding response OmpR family regulator